MESIQTIRKYPNRRLYSCAECRYITLEDIHKLALSDQDFVVIDQETQADITAATLLQVLAVQQKQGQVTLTPEFIRDLVRSEDGERSPRSARTPNNATQSIPHAATD